MTAEINLLLNCELLIILFKTSALFTNYSHADMDTQLTEEEIEADIKLLDSIVWNDNFISNTIHNHDSDIDDNEEFKKEYPQRIENPLYLEPVGDDILMNENVNNSYVQFQLSHSLLAKWNAQVEITFMIEQEENPATLTLNNDWDTVDNNLEENLTSKILK